MEPVLAPIETVYALYLPIYRQYIYMYTVYIYMYIHLYIHDIVHFTPWPTCIHVYTWKYMCIALMYMYFNV